MSKNEPMVQKFMSVSPVSIQANKTVSEAQGVMSKNGIRHLPVMQGTRVVGIVSDRDMKLASGIEGVDVEKLLVIDIASEKPFIVQPDDTLHDVAMQMASKHYGSAIVMQNEKLVGIFTTVDACRALAEVIDTRFHQK